MSNDLNELIRRRALGRRLDTRAGEERDGEQHDQAIDDGAPTTPDRDQGMGAGRRRRVPTMNEYIRAAAGFDPW